MRFLLSGVFFLLTVLPTATRADLVICRPLPGSGFQVTMQGRVERTPGMIVTVRHPQFGTFNFPQHLVKVYEAPSTAKLADKKLKKAEGDADACIEAARWALHHGFLDKFYQGAAAAWRADRNHPTVKRLVRLKGLMNAKIPVDTNREAEIRKYVPNCKGMDVVRSKHFVLMHNTGTAKKQFGRGKKNLLTPAENRLRLLETVYESFLVKFWLEGIKVDVPKERLKSVLFADRDDWVEMAMAKKQHHMTKAAGLYNKKSKVSLFYVQGTHEIFEGLDKLADKVREDARLAQSRRQQTARVLVPLAKSLDLLFERLKVNQDIEVVTHEATHQMAAATNLMPDDSGTPVWVAEGIATYFESPKEAAWAGIGGVNEERISSYRAMVNDREHSHINFVASDDVFMKCDPNHRGIAYGPAWALTHFLMAHYPDKLREFYAKLAKRKSKDFKPFPAKENLALFKSVFGEDTDALNAQWHRYMRSLKTDIEEILD